MVKRSSRLLVGAMAALLTLGSAAGVSAGGGGAGTVYTLTNAASGNAVPAFSRTAKGSLAPLATYATGGLGSGSGLGSQGAVTITSDGEWLLAVNAGSDEITSFAIGAGGRLTWTDNIASGRDHPKQPVPVRPHRRRQRHRRVPGRRGWRADVDRVRFVSRTVPSVGRLVGYPSANERNGRRSTQ